jgi:hypothetical protein
MGTRPDQPIAWLCAIALVAAAATAAMVNRSEAALFGERTIGVASSCRAHKGTACEVSIPERPDRSFKVSAPRDAHKGTEIAVRYRDDAVVADNFVERLAALVFLTLGLCVVGACLAASIARLRSRQSRAATALIVAVPIIFYSFILTTCAAALGGL